ncbi:MAG: AbrB/MazE/SpoVT family DNA-binding domain-containing protein [Terriglobales bacterium]|jgi:AbrB family looped-hinge helix DNA binding protein
MQTRVSTKGQVVLPAVVRRRLGLHAGDQLDVEVRTERIVLTPRRKRIQKAKISSDRITGVPVLDAGPDAPILTSQQVREILSDFP